MENSVLWQEHFLKLSELGNMHNFVKNSAPSALCEQPLFDIWLLIQTAELFITPYSQLVDAN